MLLQALDKEIRIHTQAKVRRSEVLQSKALR